MEMRAACRPPSVDDASRPLGRRANKRRFVSFLQQLGRPHNNDLTRPHVLKGLPKFAAEVTAETRFAYLVLR
jgi:hypothetical protein